MLHVVVNRDLILSLVVVCWVWSGMGGMECVGRNGCILDCTLLCGVVRRKMCLILLGLDIGYGRLHVVD